MAVKDPDKKKEGSGEPSGGGGWRLVQIAGPSISAKSGWVR
jgi:hypothetical protein